MEREHQAEFHRVLNRIATKIPGIDKIDSEKTADGRLLLRFNDKAFDDPFYAQQMSDGTLKIFAYLLLLEDPTPPPFICIEEPENGLYHKLLETLADEFREHATGRKGVGHLPKGMTGKIDVRKRILLDRLPQLLRGYGRSHQDFEAAVVVVVDLDDRTCTNFKREMIEVQADCNPVPTTLFRIAIEEMEAWLLGDRNAVIRAYPRAKTQILDGYQQDSICGTWELLADAIQKGAY